MVVKRLRCLERLLLFKRQLLNEQRIQLIHAHLDVLLISQFAGKARIASKLQILFMWSNDHYT